MILPLPIVSLISIKLFLFTGKHEHVILLEKYENYLPVNDKGENSPSILSCVQTGAATGQASIIMKEEDGFHYRAWGPPQVKSQGLRMHSSE